MVAVALHRKVKRALGRFTRRAVPAPLPALCTKYGRLRPQLLPARAAKLPDAVEMAKPFSGRQKLVQLVAVSHLLLLQQRLRKRVACVMKMPFSVGQRH